MSALLELQHQLRETNAALAQLGRAIAQTPDSEPLQMMFDSLEQRQRLIEGRFRQLTNESGLDVCSYRILHDRAEIPAAAVGRVLIQFQQLVSVFYDALKNGPKIRARVTSDIAAETALNFSHSFAGSTGIVLTVPNERLLMVESILDMAINRIFQLNDAMDQGNVMRLSKDVGRAGVSSLYSWAKSHAANGLGTDIEWRRGQQVRGKLLIQQPQLERLERTIAATSESKTTKYEVLGDLVGADLVMKKFRLIVDGAEDIHGSMSRDISDDQTLHLPKRYRATVEKTVRIHYATEEEDVSFHLVALNKP